MQHPLSVQERLRKPPWKSGPSGLGWGSKMRSFAPPGGPGDPPLHGLRQPNLTHSPGKSAAHTNSRSFDSVNGLASESVHSAQDDRVGVDSDFETFRAFVRAGRRLAEIHVRYEQQAEYPLIKKEKEGEKLDYRVEKMHLSKDKTILTYNQFLSLSGIPAETYEYRLGNRSALEWVIDQYQVSTDKRSGITNDPNRADDPMYILRLIGQVVSVSLETVKIVRSLPLLGLPAAEGQSATALE